MARPKLGGGETQRLHVMISEEELTAIDDWRFANRVPSRSEAVRRLVQIGTRTNEHLREVSLGMFEATSAALDLRNRLLEVDFDGSDVDDYAVEVTLIVGAHFERLTDKLFEANNLMVALLSELRPLVDAKDIAEGLATANEKKREFAGRITEWRDELQEIRKSDTEAEPSNKSDDQA